MWGLNVESSKDMVNICFSNCGKAKCKADSTIKTWNNTKLGVFALKISSSMDSDRMARYAMRGSRPSGRAGSNPCLSTKSRNVGLETAII